MDTNSEFLTVTTAADGSLEVVGDIDMVGGPILEQALLEREAALLEHEGANTVIDLREVDFMDSSGLRSLLAAARRAAARKADLELRTIGPELVRLLEITGTIDQFTIVSRRD